MAGAVAGGALSPTSEDADLAPGLNGPSRLHQASSGSGADMRIVISANALGLLVLGLFPGGLLDLCARVLGV